MVWDIGACGVILLLSTAVYGQSIIKQTVYEDYENHPCKRLCMAGQHMVCEYDFHVEYFITMGKGCGDCPKNLTHCYNRDCITSDGNQRYIMAVNQMLPGPGMHVCENDLIVVRVYNELRGREGTTIHWHGVHMKHQQHMDGTPMVTQCRIPFATSFEYRFKADTKGTHYWHAHSGSQRSEGVFGALVIRQPLSVEPHAGLYNHDLPEHTMLVMDWFTRFATEIYTFGQQGTGYTKRTTILMNGRGVEQDYFNFPDNRTRNFMPVKTFTVEQGQRYRFRVISNGINECPIQVSIDNHTLVVIAADGNPFEEVVVESFYIHSGERYDFVLDANQPIGNYWIRLQGTEFGCGPAKAYTGAILRYTGAADSFPEEEFTSYEQATRSGKSLSKWNVPSSTNDIQLTDLNSLDYDRAALKAVPDKKFYLRMNIISKETYNMGTAWFNMINDIVVRDPPSPLLTQYSELDQSIFCNEDTVNVNCSEAFCECVYRIKVALNDVIELVVIDEGRFVAVHPMHLHGHRYHVIGQGKLGETTTLQDVKSHDNAGLLNRNLINPVTKDTIASIDGGYVILRWQATNPGFWLFHCHTQLHTFEGQGLIFQVGEQHEMPQVPHKFPRCGHWKYSAADDMDDKCTNGGVKQSVHMGYTLSLALLFIKMFFF